MPDTLIDTLLDTAVSIDTFSQAAYRSASPRWLIWIILLAINVLFAFWGYMVGRRKGHGALGAVLGLFLGVIGIIIIYAIRGRSQSE
ncbi:MAG: hypothetical protein E3J71_09100 [Candidatus Stahlbacteria bacterium]|nr:MAG: hypothetical protein E3J71_09100 [Candidatus Stahlbacteria bacterium]